MTRQAMKNHGPFRQPKILATRFTVHSACRCKHKSPSNLMLVENSMSSANPCYSWSFNDWILNDNASCSHRATWPLWPKKWPSCGKSKSLLIQNKGVAIRPRLETIPPESGQVANLTAKAGQARRCITLLQRL